MSHRTDEPDFAASLQEMREKWARHVWNLDDNIFGDALARRLLGGLDSSCLMPSAERHQAIFWLRDQMRGPDWTGEEDALTDAEGAGDTLDPPMASTFDSAIGSAIDRPNIPQRSEESPGLFVIDDSRFQAKAEALLRPTVESFARRFFEMPPARRRARWTVLRERAEFSTAVTMRLRGLEPGLDYAADEPPALPDTQAEVVRFIIETFPKRPGPRAIAREAFAAAIRNSRPDWKTVVRELESAVPNIRAMGGDLLDMLTGAIRADDILQRRGTSAMDNMAAGKPMKTEKFGGTSFGDESEPRAEDDADPSANEPANPQGKMNPRDKTDWQDCVNPREKAGPERQVPPHPGQRSGQDRQRVDPTKRHRQTLNLDDRAGGPSAVPGLSAKVPRDEFSKRAVASRPVHPQPGRRPGALGILWYVAVVVGVLSVSMMAEKSKDDSARDAILKEYKYAPTYEEILGKPTNRGDNTQDTDNLMDEPLGREDDPVARQSRTPPASITVAPRPVYGPPFPPSSHRPRANPSPSYSPSPSPSPRAPSFP